jgi:hypothetical protein
VAPERENENPKSKGNQTMSFIVSHLRGERIAVEPQVEEFTIEVAGLTLRVSRCLVAGNHSIAVSVEGAVPGQPRATLVTPAPTDLVPHSDAARMYRQMCGDRP